MTSIVEHMTSPPGAAFLGLFILSWVIFLNRFVFLVRLLLTGKKVNRFDRISDRINYAIRNVIFGEKIFDINYMGFAHLFIFWGFLLFGIKTSCEFINGLFGYKIPILHWTPYVYLLDIFALLVIIGLSVGAARRAFFKPGELVNTLDSTLCIFLIFFLMVTYYLGEAGGAAAVSISMAEGYEIARIYPEMEHFVAGPVTSIIAEIYTIFAGSSQTAMTIFNVFWWAHMLGILFFLDYIVYSKHLHLATCPFNSFLVALEPKGLLPPNHDEKKPGAGRFDEFAWPQLMDGYACSECGRCDMHCPAYNSGSVLSPKNIMHEIKVHTITEGKKFLSGDNGTDIKPIIGDYIKTEELWGCYSCYSCVERCPVSNHHVPSIVQMRRRLIDEGKVDEKLSDVLNYFSRYGNSFGQSDKKRTKWVKDKDLGIKIADACKEEVEYLWFVGDYGSYDASAQPATKLFAKVMDKAGVSFGILHKDERNAGNDVRRIGEEGLFEMLLEKNIAALGKAKFKKIVTTDPHTYNTLKNEYPKFGGTYEVYHYTQILHSLIKDGKIKLTKKIGKKVTYHDPCYLGRYNGIFEEPRDVIGRTGAELREMPRNRSFSYCCGAGGGKIWMEEELKERPANSRIKEASALDIEYFVVACPKDISMFNDGVKATGNEGKIFVKDIIELVYEAMGE